MGGTRENAVASDATRVIIAHAETIVLSDGVDDEQRLSYSGGNGTRRPNEVEFVAILDGRIVKRWSHGSVGRSAPAPGARFGISVLTEHWGDEDRRVLESCIDANCAEGEGSSRRDWWLSNERALSLRHGVSGSMGAAQELQAIRSSCT